MEEMILLPGANYIMAIMFILLIAFAIYQTICLLSITIVDKLKRVTWKNHCRNNSGINHILSRRSMYMVSKIYNQNRIES